MARIVNAVLIQDDRANQAAELDQGVPIAPVTGQSRRLNGEDRTNPPLAYCCQQALKAGPADAGS